MVEDNICSHCGERCKEETEDTIRIQDISYLRVDLDYIRLLRSGAREININATQRINDNETITEVKRDGIPIYKIYRTSGITKYIIPW